MRVKSSAINRRWLATRAGLDPSRVIFVVRACSAFQKPYAIIRLRSSKGGRGGVVAVVMELDELSSRK